MAQIQLSGSVGSGGAFPILGEADVEITGDTDLVLILSQYSNQYILVTSDNTSTGVRNVIAPLNKGTTFQIENATSEGFDIVLKGPSGSGVSIPPGTFLIVATDGTNYSTNLIPKVDGAGATTDFGTTGAIAPIIATETVLAANTTVPVPSIVSKVNTTDGTTFVTAATITLLPNSARDCSFTYLGLDQTASPINGDFARGDYSFNIVRVGSGAPVVSPIGVTPTNQRSSGAGVTYATQVIIVSNTVVFQVRGNAATDIGWSVIGQMQEVH